MRQVIEEGQEGRPIAMKVIPHISLERSKAKQKVTQSS
jgi:hypothetical protein